MRKGMDECTDVVSLRIEELKRIDTVIYSWIYANRWVLLCAFLAGMFMHSQLYTAGLTQPDGVHLWYEYHPGAWEMSLGRWGLSYFKLLSGYLVSPLLASTLTVFFFTLSGVFLSDLFDVKSKLIRIFLCLYITCSPYAALVITGYAYADLYALAHLFAVVSILCTVKRTRIWAGVISSFFLMLGLSIYQSILGVAAGCGIMYLFIQLCFKQRDIKWLLIRARNILIVGVCGTGLYYAILKLHLKITGIVLADYRGASNIGLSYILQNLGHGICNAYRDFFDYFTKDTIMVNAFGIRVFYLVLFAFFVLMFIWKLLRWNDCVRSGLAVVCLAVLPIAVNLIDLVASNTRVNLLMGSGLVMTVPFIMSVMWMMAEEIGKRAFLKVLVPVLSFCILWSYVLTNAADATVTRVYNESSIALAGRIYQSLEDKGFRAHDKLIVLGKPDIANYPGPNNMLKTNFYATLGLFWGVDTHFRWFAILNSHYGLNVYQNQGYSETQEKIGEVRDDAKFQVMPVYPDEGSIQKFGEYYVVKVSEIF